MKKDKVIFKLIEEEQERQESGLELMADNGYSARVVRLGIPDKVIEHGDQPELWNECGYDAASIVEKVKEMAVSRATSTIAS